MRKIKSQKSIKTKSPKSRQQQIIKMKTVSFVKLALQARDEMGGGHSSGSCA